MGSAAVHETTLQAWRRGLSFLESTSTLSQGTLSFLRALGEKLGTRQTAKLLSIWKQVASELKTDDSSQDRERKLVLSIIDALSNSGVLPIRKSEAWYAKGFSGERKLDDLLHEISTHLGIQGTENNPVLARVFPAADFQPPKNHIVDWVNVLRSSTARGLVPDRVEKLQLQVFNTLARRPAALTKIAQALSNELPLMLSKVSAEDKEREALVQLLDALRNANCITQRTLDSLSSALAGQKDFDEISAEVLKALPLTKKGAKPKSPRSFSAKQILLEEVATSFPPLPLNTSTLATPVLKIAADPFEVSHKASIGRASNDLEEVTGSTALSTSAATTRRRSTPYSSKTSWQRRLAIGAAFLGSVFFSRKGNDHASIVQRAPPSITFVQPHPRPSSDVPTFINKTQNFVERPEYAHAQSGPEFLINLQSRFQNRLSTFKPLIASLERKRGSATDSNASKGSGQMQTSAWSNVSKTRLAGQFLMMKARVYACWSWVRNAKATPSRAEGEAPLANTPSGPDQTVVNWPGAQELPSLFDSPPSKKDDGQAVRDEAQSLPFNFTTTFAAGSGGFRQATTTGNLGKNSFSLGHFSHQGNEITFANYALIPSLSSQSGLEVRAGVRAVSGEEDAIIPTFSVDGKLAIASEAMQLNLSASVNNETYLERLARNSRGGSEEASPGVGIDLLSQLTVPLHRSGTMYQELAIEGEARIDVEHGVEKAMLRGGIDTKIPLIGEPEIPKDLFLTSRIGLLVDSEGDGWVTKAFVAAGLEGRYKKLSYEAIAQAALDQEGALAGELKAGVFFSPTKNDSIGIEAYYGRAGIDRESFLDREKDEAGVRVSFVHRF